MNNLCLLLLVGLATGFIGEKKLLAAADDMYLEGQTSGDLPIDDEDGEDDGSGSGSGDYAFSDISDKEELIRRFLFNISKTTVSKEMVPVQPQPSADSPHIPSTTTAAADSPVQRVTEKTSPGGDNSVEEVPSAGPTADWFTEHTSPSSTSLPPNEDTTTTFSIDISVTKDSDEDNSLERWDISTSRDGEGKVFISEEVDNEISASDRRINGDFSEEVTSENLWERTEVLAAVIACGVVGFLCAVFLLLLLAYRMKKKDEGSYDLGDTKLSTTAYHKAPSKEFYA